MREEEENDEPSNKQSSVFQKEQINRKPPIANQSSPGRQYQERIWNFSQPKEQEKQEEEKEKMQKILCKIWDF